MHMPLNGIANRGARGTPFATGGKCNILRLKHVDAPVAAAQRASRPARLTLEAPDAERHQRSPIVQIDSYPIPPRRLVVEILARPLVIEPGFAGDCIRAALASNRTRGAHVRQAVVVACLLRGGALLTDSRISVEENRLGGSQLKIQRETIGLDLRQVGSCVALERPAIHPNMGIAGCRLGKTQSRSANALILPQSPTLRVADGAMCDQELARGEGTGVALIDVGPRAKKRELKSQHFSATGAQPPGHVPPLGTELRMAAEIGGKLKRMVRSDGRIG